MLELDIPDNIPEQHRAVGHILGDKLTEEWARDVLVPIITGAHDVSIRVMDWYCTNWSLANKFSYHWRDPISEESRIFYVHQEYKSTLHQQGRTLFDPFRRGKRVYVTLDGEKYETTLGQLYFWWWASRYNVLESLSDAERISSVEQHMAQQHALSRERKRMSGKRKRSPLSKAPTDMHCVVHEVNCTHRFEDSDFEDDA